MSEEKLQPGTGADGAKINEEIHKLNEEIGKDVKEDASLMEELQSLNKDVAKTLEPEKKEAWEELQRLRALNLKIGTAIKFLSNLLNWDDKDDNLVSGSMTLDQALDVLNDQKREIERRFAQKEDELKSMNYRP